MIESNLFTRSVLTSDSQDKKIELENIEDQLEGNSVNKSVMYHMINSYIYTIFSSDNPTLFKKKYIFDFGKKLAFNLAEDECLGFLKYCIPKQKNDGKQFVGEMKLLNSRIWNALFGSKGKLFAISNENIKSSSYKIEDKEFLLCKSLRSTTDPQQIEFKQLALQFCEGVVAGALQKFKLQGQISVLEGTQGDVYVEIKNLVRSTTETKFIKLNKDNQENKSI